MPIPGTLCSMAVSFIQLTVVLLMYLLLHLEISLLTQSTSMEEQDPHMSHLSLLRPISLLLVFPMLCLATTGMIILPWVKMEEMAVVMDSGGQPSFFSQPLLWCWMTKGEKNWIKA